MSYEWDESTLVVESTWNNQNAPNNSWRSSNNRDDNPQRPNRRFQQNDQRFGQQQNDPWGGPQNNQWGEQQNDQWGGDQRNEQRFDRRREQRFDQRRDQRFNQDQSSSQEGHCIMIPSKFVGRIIGIYYLLKERVLPKNE